MFNLSGSEIFFLLLIALVVLGPEKLPEAMRRFGKTYAEVKKMSSGFQSELKSALDEPMREMRDTADALRKAANFDLDGDLADSSTAARAAAGADATTATRIAAGNEPPLAQAAPFQSVIISGGDARVATGEDAAQSGADAAPADDAAADDVAAVPPSEEAQAAPAPIVRAPGINFGSANPRPTAALRDATAAPNGDLDPSAEGATAE
jgi:sec-independent protein translocase protein TatB